MIVSPSRGCTRVFYSFNLHRKNRPLLVVALGKLVDLVAALEELVVLPAYTTRCRLCCHAAITSATFCPVRRRLEVYSTAVCWKTATRCVGFQRFGLYIP